MKKTKLIFLAGIVLILTAINLGSIKAQTNIALNAEISTSHVSPWETLEAVNDDYQPENSGDYSHGGYGNWQGSDAYDTLDWVEYTFPGKSQVDSVRVYWWTDNGGLQMPYESYVEYWGCNEHINAGPIPAEVDKYNTLVLDVETYKIRVSMRSTAATGILEFQVWGSTGAVEGLVPYVQVNSEAPQQVDVISVSKGDKVSLSNGLLNIEGANGWNWTGPKGFTSTDSMVVIENIEGTQMGIYTASIVSDCGIEFSQTFIVKASIPEGTDQAYTWPSYTPTLDYHFRNEFPDLEMPTQNLQDCSESVTEGQVSSGWWTFVYGPNKRSTVTENAIDNMLEHFNTDFGYIRDTMGWPPDKRAKEGYRSTIMLYGSGLCTDNADSNAGGGWQGSINGYPMVLASYYPVQCYDDNYTEGDKGWQTGAMIHEGIHAILADMPGVKKANWFHEGGNTWLQQEMGYRRSGKAGSMGFLNGCTMLAPFMPIECYSGWLQDGSFGGPSAEGVNRYSGSTQLCTWVNYLGGNQYGNTFPTLLGQILGKGSIPWIWRYCPERVLEGMADSLGDYQMRRLITEYRARQALVDMGEWTGALRDLLDNNIYRNIGPEYEPHWLEFDTWVASPYARTVLDTATGILTPEYRTTPGWSGANQIPLKVKSDSISISFQPIDKNMKCLLAYRDVEGNCVYSEPVDSGTCAMALQRTPANDAVIAVVVNTDYKYLGEETRKAHFDYRLQIDTSMAMPANSHKRWYAYDENPDADIVPDLPPISLPDTFPPSDLSLQLVSVYESDPVGTEIGIFATLDSNNVTGNIHRYQLVTGDGDTDNGFFKIVTGGKLTIKKELDYETQSLYHIRVRSTDIHLQYIEETFEIPVLDAEESALDLMSSADNNITIFPNPFDESAVIRLLNDDLIRSVEVKDIMGKTIRSFENINSSEFILEKDDLSTGLYYVVVTAESTYIKRLMIK